MRKLFVVLLTLIALTACTKEVETVETVTDKVYDTLVTSNVLQMSGDITISINMNWRNEYNFEKVMQMEPFVYYEKHETIPYRKEFYVTDKDWFKMDRNVNGFVRDTRENAEKQIIHLSDSIIAEAKSVKKLADVKEHVTLEELVSPQYKLTFDSEDSEVLAKYLKGNFLSNLIANMYEYKITKIHQSMVIDKETFKITNQNYGVKLIGKMAEDEEEVEIDITINIMDVNYDLENTLEVPQEVIEEAARNSSN